MATSLGVVLALFPYAAICATGVFIITLLVFHYVSLGSVSAAFVFPFFNIFVFNASEWAYLVFSVTVAIFVIVMHSKNIKRLRNGAETKFFFKKKKPLAR